MTCGEIVVKLRDQITRALSPQIDADYWLLEVPHYANIGDTLIWQGELDFLKGCPYRCKGMYAWDSLTTSQLKSGDLVLFQGGGNFGDVWDPPQEYRKRIMSANPDCRYLVFPQTVYWEGAERLKEDAAFFSRFDCTICARDQASYDVLKTNFKNEILLVPDMAFFIDMRRWARWNSTAERPLLLMRQDKELHSSPALDEVKRLVNIDITDWLTMTDNTEASIWQRRIYNRVRTHPRKLGWLYDFYMRQFYRPAMIRSGVELISSHTDIYTTRLHACILSVLLGKERISMFDNSYGKNRGFYETWLNDCDNVKLQR